MNPFSNTEPARSKLYATPTAGDSTGLTFYLEIAGIDGVLVVRATSDVIVGDGRLNLTTASFAPRRVLAKLARTQTAIPRPSDQDAEREGEP